MNRLPDRVNLDHLKKQAKGLLRSYRARDAAAFARFREALPAARGRSDEEIAALDLRLHDAQSCVARSYGLASWAELRTYVEAREALQKDRPSRILHWLKLVYAGDIYGTFDRARPLVAARLLAESPDLAAGSPYLACAIGDTAVLSQATDADPYWVNRAVGPLKLPPLVAVTHSSLLRVPEFRDRRHACARLLLAAGADPNQRIGGHFPPASLDRPDDGHPLSALYGAAGSNHDAALAALLLDAGADPNDGESTIRWRVRTARGCCWNAAPRRRHQCALPCPRPRCLRGARASACRGCEPERAGGRSADQPVGIAAAVGDPAPPFAPACRGSAEGGSGSVHEAAGRRGRLQVGAAARAR
jgi:hypothetical protein